MATGAFHIRGGRVGLIVPVVRLRVAPNFVEGGRGVPISLAERVRGPDR